MTKKNRDLQPILMNIGVGAQLSGRTFAKALYKNVRLMEQELKDIEKLKESSKKYQELQELIRKKHELHADRDGSKKPPVAKTEIKELPDGRKVEDFVVTIPANQKKIDDYVKRLKKDNPKIFKDQEEKIQMFVDDMNADCDIKFHMVKEDKLPEEMTPEQMFIFDFMIEFKK